MKFNHLLNSIETTHVHFQEVAAKLLTALSLSAMDDWMLYCRI